MRIIAGSLGGRIVKAPKNSRTHPMSEKMRGALFNSLGNINGLSVLDPFAGTGALSFEALSRGATSATVIDTDKKAWSVINEACRELSLDKKCKIIRANASGWSDNNPDSQFDIIVADPPYIKLQTDLIQKLTKHLAKKGMLVLSWPGKKTAPEFEKMVIKNQKNYGDAQLIYYRWDA